MAQSADSATRPCPATQGMTAGVPISLTHYRFPTKSRPGVFVAIAWDEAGSISDACQHHQRLKYRADARLNQ
jgi:hypothetical protein